MGCYIKSKRRQTRTRLAVEGARKEKRESSEKFVFIVEFKNRVIRKRSRRRITGTQGQWYHEEKIVIAHDESEIEPLISKKLESRQILGKPLFRLPEYERELKITNIKRTV